MPEPLSDSQRRLTLLLNHPEVEKEMRKGRHFRSLPYDADNALLFPSKSAQPLQFNVSNTLFSIRCFPMPTRHPNGNPHPVPVSASKDLPSPPPTFVGLTDDDPSHIDPFLSTPEAVRRHLAQLKKQKKPYTMDLTIMAGKKKVHKSACIRDRCKRRFKEAVRMVVVRAARKVENAPGGIAVSEEVVGETGPRKWLMAGYCYIVSIDLEMYRYPLPDLVEHVRTALLELKRKAEQAALEAQLEDLEISPRARQPDESSH
ncbi:hypothetical protein JCM10295v2_001026 [Rhodotorula toruloides]